MCQAVCNTISICLFSCKSTHLMLISGSSECVYFSVSLALDVIRLFLYIGSKIFFLVYFFFLSLCRFLFSHDLRLHLDTKDDWWKFCACVKWDKCNDKKWRLKMLSNGLCQENRRDPTEWSDELKPCVFVCAARRRHSGIAIHSELPCK